MLCLIIDTNILLTDMLLRYQKIELIPPIPYGTRLICADSQKRDTARRSMNSTSFHRVWVMQETALARSSIVIQGKRSLERNYLVELVLLAASHADFVTHTGDVRAT